MLRKLNCSVTCCNVDGVQAQKSLPIEIDMLENHADCHEKRGTFASIHKVILYMLRLFHELL